MNKVVESCSDWKEYGWLALIYNGAENGTFGEAERGVDGKAVRGNVADGGRASSVKDGNAVTFVFTLVLLDGRGSVVEESIRGWRVLPWPLDLKRGMPLAKRFE